VRPEEKGSASPLVVRNALFTLAWLESASVSGQRERGGGKVALLAECYSPSPVPLLGPIASRIYRSMSRVALGWQTTRSVFSGSCATIARIERLCVDEMALTARDDERGEIKRLENERRKL
jgi:hypothetical protein